MGGALALPSSQPTMEALGVIMLVFDHVGLTTTDPQHDENWIEQSLRRRRLRAHRIHAQIWGDFRIHAIPERWLVQRLSFLK
jgi:hypothetical protein